MNRRLYRSDDDRVIAGVAGGIAETYDFDPALVRVAWALLILFSGGVFLILYIIMALVIPLAPDDMPATMPPGAGSIDGAPTDDATQTGFESSAAASAAPGAPVYMSERAARRARRRERAQGGSDMAGPVVFGLILILIGGFFLLREYLPAVNWGQLWPILLIGIGGVLLLAAFTRNRG